MNGLVENLIQNHVRDVIVTTGREEWLLMVMNMWGDLTIYNARVIFEKEYQRYIARIYNCRNAYYAEIIINNKAYREPEQAGVSRDHLECILSALRYKVLALEGIEINDARIFADFKLRC
ncbi:MAG: hypothetical protein KatS3mg003_2230 [Candidatus Nitrosocaldaceae archaeon]|nr:MAG: hypothetical protein KatS3mg003_2168 [Candidatus Nitrosocaldaceae archaeon]GIU72751.1 MAG: hypothetical protein KatS3mg003_2230 [Candidatus Nitrosocaldaceae archaeon]